MKPTKCRLAILIILGVTLPTAFVIADTARTALVIGNSQYLAAPLSNPVNDAQDVASTLRELGFTVILQTNANQRQIDDAIDQFGRTLDAKKGVGLFFYAGHGVQSQGRNYIIPVNANLEREKDLKYNAIDVGKVLDEMGAADNGLNIVVLDACRDNPLAKNYRSSHRGLVRMSHSPKGTLIAYSTSPGDVAEDGAGRNSPYTKHFIKALKAEGLPFEVVFKNVAKGVEAETRHKQTPWTASSVTGDFYFNPINPINTAVAKIQIEKVAIDAAMVIPKHSTVTPSVNLPGHESFIQAQMLYLQKHRIPLAFEHYTNAANAGHPLAMAMLAKLYTLNDYGLTKDLGTAKKFRNKAFTAIEKMAIKGDVDAQFGLAYLLEAFDENYERAVQWYRQAAEQGSPLAQNNLGVMYDIGKGLIQDDELAVQWYRKAAEQNYARAQNNLGGMYEEGKGVPQDDAQAVYWYKRSAELNYAEAQVNLGEMYAENRGVGWFGASDHKAKGWYLKAAEQNYARALANLGWMYEEGKGVDQDDEQAFLLFKRAADQHNAEGYNGMGWMYEQGRGVEEDTVMALKLYRMSAKKGNAWAQNQLRHRNLKW